MSLAFDKKLHLILGFFISLSTFLILEDYNLFDREANVFIGAGMGFFAGLVKEIRDKKSYGKFDKMDLAYTIVGAFAAVIVYEAISQVIFNR